MGEHSVGGKALDLRNLVSALLGFDPQLKPGNNNNGYLYSGGVYCLCGNVDVNHPQALRNSLHTISFPQFFNYVNKNLLVIIAEVDILNLLKNIS